MDHLHMFFLYINPKYQLNKLIHNVEQEVIEHNKFMGKQEHI